MDISVIVPLYNAEKYVHSLLEVVKDNAHASVEFIFVDDGSNDQTLYYCTEAQKTLNQLKVIHQKNSGVSVARNTGLEAASGEYICFLDADDKPKKEMYQKLSSIADTFQCDMVMGGYEKVDAEGRHEVANMPYDGFVLGGVKEIAYSMAFWRGSADGKPIHMLYGSVWPNLYKKSIIDRYSIRFPAGVVLGEDLLFNLLYLSHCSTVYMINQPLYEYSAGNQSATRKQVPDLWERYVILTERVKETLQRNYGDSRELRLNDCCQSMNYAIGVIEEQILPFYSSKDQVKRIKKLCNDKQLQNAVKYILKNESCSKAWLQAFLFRYKLVGALRLWLKL